jgi:hypothetical protein
MIKIGIMLDNVGPNQLAHYIINSGNKFLEKNSRRSDLIMFIHNVVSPCAHINFSVMNVSEAYDFDGFLVATSLHTAAKLAKTPGTKKKFFYVWDLEWLRPYGRNFEGVSALYKHPQIELIARSQPHKDLIELSWKPTIGIVEDGRVEQFYKLFESIT